MPKGYQSNNQQPRGMGQPQQGKDSRKPRNFMVDVMGGEMPVEPVAPGIPPPVIGASVRQDPSASMASMPRSYPYQGQPDDWQLQQHEDPDRNPPSQGGGLPWFSGNEPQVIPSVPQTMNPYPQGIQQQPPLTSQSPQHSWWDRVNKMMPNPSIPNGGQPTSNTMPVGGNQPQVQPAGVPQAYGQMPPVNQTGGFQGQGQGWRGLDLTPTTNSGVNGFSGFNMDRAMAGGDPNSVKDTFARWATGLGSLQGLDMQGVGSLINSNLDRARAMGLNILEVNGDKILIDAREHGPVWVDVVQDAGGQNPMWAWQPDLAGQSGPPMSAPANDMYSYYQNQLNPPQEEDQLEELIMALMSQNQELI